MALGHLAGAGHDTLYVSGEESAAQIRLRAERLARGAAPAAMDVPVLAETDVDAVCAVLEAERPAACVVDSVQTLSGGDLGGAPGSVGQVREVATRIMEVAKRQGTAVLLVGHVTKEGALAGPRVLEHLVDCVLQFEGERERTYRTLRAHKNRFGSTNDVGVFEMREGGLVEVLDASARFVAEATRAPGSVVLASMEGSRPLLVEVQALVSPSELVPPGASAPAMTATGWPSCWPSWGATRAWRWAAPTSSSTSSAACASTSRAPTWRSRWRWRAPRAVSSAAVTTPRSRASARSASRASCARSPTPTAAWPRPRSSASGASSRRRAPRRCAPPCVQPWAPSG